ncbi:MAG: hypothetical protein ACR5LG_03215 [Sodalis sp. (in: enterobacteria)]|uniref:hypothetical protein n=1 Tax=Sodalis sp. (in: enterobacteria) TaxID=1898979 RepID=UPI003F37F50C
MKPQDVMSPVLAELRTIRTQLDGIDRRLDRLQVKGARHRRRGRHRAGAHTGATGGCNGAFQGHPRGAAPGLCVRQPVSGAGGNPVRRQCAFRPALEKKRR